MDLYGRLLRGVLFPGFEALRGRPTVALQRYLDRTQWASADELHAIQSGLLRRLVRHAYRHTDWYRDVLDRAGVVPDDIRGPEDLVLLPLLEKDHARDSMDRRTSKAPPFAVIRKSTSGSTGQPVTVEYNAESRHWRDATRWRGYGWAGYRVGSKALHYWGFGAIPPATRLGKLKVELDHRLKRDRYVDCSPRGDQHLAQVVEQIEQFQPDVMICFSQAGGDLAQYVLRTGRRAWGDVAVLCGAEPLFPHHRRALTAAFGPRVFETYGAREFMLIGHECEAHDGMHTSMETMITELVVRQPDGTSRPARLGESGEVVITDLHNLAMPLLRYVNGDLAVQRPGGGCTCGRALDRIGPIEGRITETLRDGQGNPVNGLVFNIMMVSIAEQARQFQVIQHLDRRVTIKIVPVSTLPASTFELIDRWTAKYLPGIPVEVEVVDDIAPGAAGKRRPVVVEKPEPG